MRRRLSAAVAVLLAGIPAGVSAAEPSVWQRERLTGDWNGVRTSLANQGVDFTFNYIGEAFGVMSGGIDRRTSYQGRLEISADTDLQKLIGWSGARTHVTIYHIHSSAANIGQNAGSIANPSNIDAERTTRLFTAWFEQSFNDVVSVRVGQLAADDEFLVSPTAGGLVNGTFGWAAIVGANLISEGPSYPLAAPGARVKATVNDSVSVLAAVFSGNPVGPDCFASAQTCNRHGTTFSFSGGALWISEVQYAINQGKQALGLPGVYKLGVWYATADYADQHCGIDGTGAAVSLGVDPTADPRRNRGNWGVYGVADQMVWRSGETNLRLFARAGIVPSDRNLVSYYVDGGAAIAGLLPGRADDVLTFGVAYIGISKDAAAADRDALAFNGPPGFIRNEEIVFEMSYTAQIAPWWTVQPDLQVIVHPGGHVADPNDANRAIGNAFIMGVRSTMTF